MNVINKALASSFLTASMALGAVGVAEAGPVAGPSLNECVTLGQSKGVYEYPAAKKAFQQQGSLACEFGYGAGQQFIPIKAYDMNNARDAQAYTRSVSTAENTEIRAAANAQRQADLEQRRADAEARRNNPVRQIQDGVRDIRNLDNARKQLENIFKR
jgi:hypothetical protein